MRLSQQWRQIAQTRVCSVPIVSVSSASGTSTDTASTRLKSRDQSVSRWFTDCLLKDYSDWHCWYWHYLHTVCGAESVKQSSVRLSVCSIIRPQQRRAAGLLLSAGRAGDISWPRRAPSSNGAAAEGRSTAHGSKCGQCHVDKAEHRVVCIILKTRKCLVICSVQFLSATPYIKTGSKWKSTPVLTLSNRNHISHRFKIGINRTWLTLAAPNMTEKFSGRWLLVERAVVLSKWRGHVENITCLALAEDQQLLVTSSLDCTARVWTYAGHYVGTSLGSVPLIHRVK